MDKRVIIIAVLALLAVFLTVIRESGEGSHEPFSGLLSAKEEISGDRVRRMADTTLTLLGIKKGNIRPVKNRNDVRVLMPAAFDPLMFVIAMSDSLREYDAAVHSSESARDKSTLVQITRKEAILKSYLFSFEPVPIVKKGVSPSVPKKQSR